MIICIRVSNKTQASLPTLANGLGPDPDKWPKRGCKANFSIWGKGPSNVVIVKVTEGMTEEWVCFMAVRLPVELEDEIRKVQEAFHTAQGQLIAADIMKSIPLVYPKTRAIDPICLPGVSKRNYARLEEDGSLLLDHRRFGR